MKQAIKAILKAAQDKQDYLEWDGCLYEIDNFSMDPYIEKIIALFDERAPPINSERIEAHTQPGVESPVGHPHGCVCYTCNPYHVIGCVCHMCHVSQSYRRDHTSREV